MNKIGNLMHGLPVVLGVVLLSSSFWLDDLRLNPTFWWPRNKDCSSRRLEVDPNIYGFEAVRITADPGGAGDSLMSAEIIYKEETIFTVGGREPVFIGFKDLRGRGRPDLICIGSSRYSTNGVWQIESGSVSSAPRTLSSDLYGYLVQLMFWAPYLAAGSVIYVLAVIYYHWRYSLMAKRSNASGTY